MTIFYYEISFTLIYLLRLTVVGGGGVKKRPKDWKERMPERLGLSLDFSSNTTTWVMTFKGQLFLAKYVENWSW